jgi:hypothetical protein
VYVLSLLLCASFIGCESSRKSYTAEGAVFALNDRETPLMVHMLYSDNVFEKSDEAVAVQGVEISVSSTSTPDSILPGSTVTSD